MKKTMTIMLAICMIFTLASCATMKYNVTYMDSDGVTVLKETAVAEGKTIGDPALEKDGYMIDGYYATPALIRPFDMDKAITEDTTVFVAWKSAVVDERPWVLAGSFRAYPENAWGKIWPQDDFLLEKVDGEFNTYTKELDLFKGDEFKIAVIGEGYAWDSENELNASNLADHSEDSPLFSGENAFDTGANIKVVKDGHYRLTVVTDAETISLCKISIERLGDPKEIKEIQYDMKLWASFNDWAGADMKQNGTDKIWYTEADVPAGGGEFGIKNVAGNHWFSSENNTKNIVLDEGHYMFFIELEEKDGVPVLKGDIVAETPAYYVVGTCGNGAWAGDANASNEEFKMVEKDGKYVLDVDFKDSETADWAGGKVAFKVVYGAGGRVANEYWYGNGGDNVLVDPGKHQIVFDPVAKTVTVD